MAAGPTPRESAGHPEIVAKGPRPEPLVTKVAEGSSARRRLTATSSIDYTGVRPRPWLRRASWP